MLQYGDCILASMDDDHDVMQSVDHAVVVVHAVDTVHVAVGLVDREDVVDADHAAAVDGMDDIL